MKPILIGGSLCAYLYLAASSVGAEQPQPAILANAGLHRVLIAAHRGGYEIDKADRAPENSVTNIRNSQKKGYELYETDIQRTRDGRFVIMHDKTIERETTGRGMVSEMTLVELKQLRKRYRDGSVSDETVATLEEFLDEGAGRTIFKADLKPGVSAHFAEIVRLVESHKAMGRIIFRVPYGEADQFVRFRTGGLPYDRSLFMFKVSNKNQLDDIQRRFDPLTIQVDLNKAEPTRKERLELIRYATDKGLLVETHAEGDADDWERLIKAGVRMFHTGKPSKVRSFLLSRASESGNCD